MNTQALQLDRRRAGQAFPQGRAVADMRFWDRPFPDLDPQPRNRRIQSGTGWLDGAQMEALGAPLPCDRGVEVQWMSDVQLRSKPPAATLSGRLGEMVDARDWEVPQNLLDPIAGVRQILGQQQGMGTREQVRMVQRDWPEVWRELRLYERRRLLAAAESGQWNYHITHPRTHAQWEATAQAAADLARQVEQVNARSYVSDPDPLLHHRPVVGLDSFLPGGRGSGSFHIG